MYVTYTLKLFEAINMKILRFYPKYNSKQLTEPQTGNSSDSVKNVTPFQKQQ